MSTNIIAFSGLKNSGKDTASNMMRYLLIFPKFMHNYTCYKLFNPLLKYIKKWKIKRFADPIKQILAILLNVNPKIFENRKFKEQTCVQFPELKLLDINCAQTIPENKFSKMVKYLNPNISKDYNLTIRQLMQYFGTEIMRTFFGDSLWTHSILNKKENMIISDLRFCIEMEALKQYNAFTILIKRNSCMPGEHPSEKEIIKMEKEYDLIIENNKSLCDLFNNLKDNFNKI